MYILIIVSLILLILFITKKTKRLKLDCLTLVVGGVKCGKTTLSVYLALKAYKRALFKWKLSRVFCKLLRKPIKEKPLLYSNIPLGVPYVPITKDLLLRKERFNFKSVVLLSETSLIADSMSYKDSTINEDLTLFYKLIGHELHGGAVFVETQNPSDNHYALKRSLGRFIYISSLTKFIPFVLLYRVREVAYLDGVESIQNNFNEDIEDTSKLLIISKRVWKKFDAYTYRGLTDHLPNNDKIITSETLVSCDYITLNKRGEKNENS